MSSEQAIERASGPDIRRKGILRRFIRNRKGTTSIEFAILALPFFVVIFASLETFAAFYGDQLWRTQRRRWRARSVPARLPSSGEGHGYDSGAVSPGLLQ